MKKLWECCEFYFIRVVVDSKENWKKVEKKTIWDCKWICPNSKSDKKRIRGTCFFIWCVEHLQGETVSRQFRTYISMKHSIGPRVRNVGTNDIDTRTSPLISVHLVEELGAFCRSTLQTIFIIFHSYDSTHVSLHVLIWMGKWVCVDFSNLVQIAQNYSNPIVNRTRFCDPLLSELYKESSQLVDDDLNFIQNEFWRLLFFIHIVISAVYFNIYQFFHLNFYYYMFGWSY